jgi:hypothetical protein
MSALTRAEAEGVLKDIYLPVIRKQLNQETILLDKLEQTSKNVEGEKVVFSAHVRRNSGKGARLDNEDLPDPGHQKHVKGESTMKYNYMRGTITGPTLAAAKSDKGSFVRPMTNEIEGAILNTREDFNRQLWGTSDGVIAYLEDTGSSNTVQLKATGSDAGTLVQIGQIHEGDKVDIGTPGSRTSSQSRAANREVQSVDIDAKTFVIDGAAINVAAGEAVFVAGSGGSGAEQRELTGLQTIVNDADDNLFNIDTGLYGSWKSTVDSNGGTLRSLTEGKLMSVSQRSASRRAVGKTNLGVASFGVFQNFYNQLSSRRQIVNTEDIGGGYSGLYVQTMQGKIAFTFDKDCPANSFWGLDTQQLTINQESDWELMGEDGSRLSRVPNRDAYEFTVFKYAELTTQTRNAHFVIKDLQEDTE